MTLRADPRRHPAIASGFIALALLLGGGGTPNPATEILLELAFALALLAWLWLPSGAPGARPPIPAGVAPWTLAGLVALVPLVQLVPLPAGLWHALAGQQDVRRRWR